MDDGGCHVDAADLFAQTGATVYRCACHLARGSGAQADELLVATFVAAAHAIALNADDPDHIDAPGAVSPASWPITLLCRIAVAGAQGPERSEVVGIAVGEMRSLGDDDLGSVARRLDVPVTAITSPPDLGDVGVIDPGRRSPDAPRSTERWLDDATRARVLAALAEVTSGAGSGVGAHARDRGSRGHRRDASPRRRGRASLLLVVAAAGAGLVINQHDRDGRQGANRITAPAATPVVGAVLDPAPAGYRVTNAFERVTRRAGSGWFQLWAEPGATRTDGAWMAIATTAEAASGRFVLERSSAVQLGGMPARASTAPDGIRLFTVEGAAGSRVSLEAGGLTDAELGQVLVSISSTISAPEPSAHTWPSARPEDATNALLRAHRLDLIASAPSSFGILPTQVRSGQRFSTSYQTADLDRRMTLSVGPTSADDLLAGRFLLAASPDPRSTVAPDHTMVVGDLVITVGIDVAEGPKTSHVLQWHDAEMTFTLAGTAELAVLLSAVATVRSATGAEWATLLHLPPSYVPTVAHRHGGR